MGTEQFYKETAMGKLIPRTIFIDSESESVDQVRNGFYRNLLFPE